MHDETKRKRPHLFGFLFYFIFFVFITGGMAMIYYWITLPLACSKIAEKLWRKVTGVRPLRLEREKERLLPLFKEVYEGAVKADPELSKGIKIYIKEDMSVNAFAFGRETLVLTRGSIELLNDECLKGLIAHEFGHFSNYDTAAALLTAVGNLPLSYIVAKMYNVKSKNDEKKRGVIIGFFRFIYNSIYYLFKTVQTLGNLVIKRKNRKQEYRADAFALESGFGRDLANVLVEIYSMSFEKPKSVKEQLNSSHPPITLRIERLEEAI